MINFPTSPALNEVFSSGGKIWKWDCEAWVYLASSSGGSSFFDIDPVIAGMIF